MSEQTSKVSMHCPACAECKTRESTFWHRRSSTDVLCDSCHENQRDPVITRTLRSQSGTSVISDTPNKTAEDQVLAAENGMIASHSSSSVASTTRKSNRLRPATKARVWQNAAKSSSTKGRSRRFIFKKNPLKAPVAVSSIVTSDYIFYEGSYWQVGDIVSVLDEDDQQLYYAQLRGFLQDQYCNKSAVITWLVPVAGAKITNPSEFNPAAYVAGPEEDLPRDMSFFEFVCHAPVDYFCQRSTYRCHVVNPPALNCVWTPFGPDIQQVTTTCSKSANSADLLELNQKTAATSNSILEAQIIAVNETERRSDRDTSRRASFAKDRQPSNKAVLNRLKDKIAR